MAMQIVVSVKGLNELKTKLAQAGISLKDWSRELRSSGDYLKDFYSDKVVGSGGGAISEIWPALKTGGPSVLVDTGRMQRSFRYMSTSTLMSLFNTTDYFRFHQTGTRKMPMRMVFKITDKIANDVGEIFVKGLTRRINKVFK